MVQVLLFIVIIAAVGAGAYRVGERDGFADGRYRGAFDMWACVNIAPDLARCPRPSPTETQP